MIDVGANIPKLKKLSKDFKTQAKRYDAIQRQHISFQKRVGESQVIVSKRKKMPWEKGRQAHGRIIAAMFRKLKKPIFKYTKGLDRKIQKNINKKVRESIRRAGRKRRVQSVTPIIAAIKKGGDILVEDTRHRMIHSKVGKNSRTLRNIKVSLVHRERATIEYGLPPPYSIRTGRFIDGIRTRYRKTMRKR